MAGSGISPFAGSEARLALPRRPGGRHRERRRSGGGRRSVGSRTRSLRWTSGVLMYRSPARASPAEDPKLKSSATRTAGVHLSRRRITGSASCPRTAAMPMPVQRRAGQRGPLVPSAFVAATKAAKGIGQGAAMPAPHPTTSPAGTVSGSLRPSASVGSCSRTATALANPTAPANPSAATRSAVFSFTPAMTSRVTRGVA